MIKRRKRLAIAVVIVGGAAALAAIVVHTLLPGSVIASVDVGPGYAPVSLTVDAGMGVAYVGRQDGGVTLLSTRTGRALRTLPASTGRPGAVSVAVAERLGRVYLAHGYTWAGIPGNALDILDARRQTLLHRRRVRNLSGYMVVGESLNTLFVATQTVVATSTRHGNSGSTERSPDLKSRWQRSTPSVPGRKCRGSSVPIHGSAAARP